MAAGSLTLGGFECFEEPAGISIPLLGTCVHSWIGAVRSPDRSPVLGGQPVVRRGPSQARHVKVNDPGVTLAHILTAAADTAGFDAFGGASHQAGLLMICSQADGPPVVRALLGVTAGRQEASWSASCRGCGLRLRRTVGFRRAGVKDADGSAGGSFDEVEMASVVVGLESGAQKTAKRDRARIERFEDYGQHLSSAQPASRRAARVSGKFNVGTTPLAPTASGAPEEFG